MTTFLEGVNRILRENTILAGDDADLTTFNTTQHKATCMLAEIAIQNTLTFLIADKLIPYEVTDGNITYVSGTRVYDLPGDFIRFVDESPFLLELDSNGNSANIYVPKYPGGEEMLSREVLNYRSQSGAPIYFYEVKGTTKKIGLFQVPDSSKDGVITRFRYEKSVYITSESDILPFHTTQEAHIFLSMASRYFRYLNANQSIGEIEDDPVYKVNKNSLMNLIKITKASSHYGYDYI